MTAKRKEPVVGKRKTQSRPQQGFSILEVMITVATLLPGIMALAAVLLTVNTSQTQIQVRSQVLAQAQSLMEEIRGAEPSAVFDNYDGLPVEVDGVVPAMQGSEVINVTVLADDPSLLVVIVTGNWLTNGNVETLVLTTEVFDDGA